MDSDVYLDNAFYLYLDNGHIFGPDIFGCVQWPGVENGVEGEF